MAHPRPATTNSLIRSIKGHKRHYSAPIDYSIPAAKQKYVPKSGTYPKGFLVSGVHVGVKKSNTRFPDLAFIASETLCSGAAVFTTNKFQAAPVLVSKRMLEEREGTGIRSIIINSGCANAITGEEGHQNAIQMALDATKTFPEDIDDNHLSRSIVMSTGVIGQQLPYMSRIQSKIPTARQNLASTHEAWLTAARAICTTDTFPKLLSTTFTLPGKPHEGVEYRLAGMAKGAGMIHPNMATLLGIFCTDAPISPTALRDLLTESVNKSFNSISIDGDTSTNDTVAILANGAALPSPFSSSHEEALITSRSSAPGLAMQKTLTDFSQRLAQLVVRDGEGATKFVTVNILRSKTHADARLVASTIARSPLVKTALYGKDANWGRILCAIGYTQGLSPGAMIPERTSLRFVPGEGSASEKEGSLELLKDGEPVAVDEERAARLLQDEDLRIDVELGTGEEEATYWFCDFSHEYVTINGDYRT